MFRTHILKFLAKAPALPAVRNVATVTRTGTKYMQPGISSVLFTNNSWIWQKPEPLKPPQYKINPIVLPDNLLRIPPITEYEKNTEKVIEDPLSINNNSKEAARLIVIRRKKMKKHKLKKLRKRMKFEWAKVRQRRELKKEKEFQAGLIAQYKQAEAFSAEQYIADKLKQAAWTPPLPFTKTDEFKELMRQKRLRLNIEK